MTTVETPLQLSSSNTHIQISQLVNNRLVVSLWSSCNTVVISSSCYKLACCRQSTCYVQAISDLLGQLVTSPMKLSTLLQKMLTTCFRFVKQLGTSSANAFWYYRLDGQICCNLVAGLWRLTACEVGSSWWNTGMMVLIFDISKVKSNFFSIGEI